MSNTVLSLKNIARTFKQGGNALTVLHDLNLDVKAGEVVALVGPSGSGKTTLLQIAGLLDSPSAGEITIAGEPMEGATDKERTEMRRSSLGFVYQFHHLLPEFSALENVAMPQMIAGKSKGEAHKKSEQLLTGLGLSARKSHRPARLSGGEQQRVAIARALANDPKLLLADEPTGNLDPVTAAEVFTLFMELARQKNLAALVATHNMELAGRMDRIVRLEGGTVK